MTRRTFVRPEAQADIREAAKWYEGREVGLGIRFIGEIRASVHTSLTTLFGFQSSIAVRAALCFISFHIPSIFVNEPEAAAIIAVLHQHRRPADWQSRR